MKANSTLENVFIHELKDLYSAEKQLTKALPKMAKAATSPKLREAFEQHLEETEQHVNRLEQAFEALEVAARAIKCKAMEGLIEEGQDVLEGPFEDAARDAALIALANKVEHYEIASYGTVAAFARQLGHSELEQLLTETLQEERYADQLLTEMAETEINPEADAGAESGSTASSNSARRQ